MRNLIIYITALLFSVVCPLVDAETLHTPISGETIEEFTSPLNMPEGIPIQFNYLINTKADISILDAQGQEAKAIKLSMKGVSIGEHETFELKRGDYTVKETFTVIAEPDSVFLQGQVLESKANFDWKFTAEDDGIYDFFVAADASNLKLDIKGDLTLKSIGEMGDSTPIVLATTRFIKANEKMRYTATYTVQLSKTSAIELISQVEEPVAIFVVTGIVRHEDGTVVPNAAVAVSNETRNLSEIANSDEGGIYKVTFVGPKGSVLAQAGDLIKVAAEDSESSYTLEEEDIAKGRSVVNLLLKQPVPPMIEAASPPVKLISGNDARVWVKVVGAVASVNVTVTSPKGESISTVPLSDSSGDGIFEGQITGLLGKGKYSLSIHAQNTKGDVSNTVKSYITTVPWDVNQDGKVDIVDLMLVGKNYGEKEISYGDDCWTSDINGDNLINLRDLLFVGKHFGERYHLSGDVMLSEN